MGLYDNPDFDVINRSSVPYRLNFNEVSSTPVLDTYIARGDPKSGKPFAPRDLHPARVGYIAYHDYDIDCLPMTWAQHVWTNLDEVRAALPQDERLHAMSVSVLLETVDGMFPLAMRSKQVELYPEHWHVSAAGYVDLLKAQRSGSLLHSVFAEIHEEINVSPGDITHMEQLGLCRPTRANQALVEACFYARTSLTGDKVLSLAQSARDTYEGKVHLFPKEIISNMLAAEPFVPNALATILLAFER